jgi:hypothetical protein
MAPGKVRGAFARILEHVGRVSALPGVSGRGRQQQSYAERSSACIDSHEISSIGVNETLGGLPKAAPQQQFSPILE